MTRTDAADELKALRQTIRQHNRLYYLEAAPDIEDREYDRLFQRLLDLEGQFPDLVTPDSPSQRVGGEPLDAFRTVPHAVPMLSLDNTYNEQDLQRFHDYVLRQLGNAEPVSYTVEPKVDGISISLRYEDGVLTQALTRGNGQEGDDVTANVRTIATIPLRLDTDAPPPAVFEARGEVYMSKRGFAELNRRRTAAGEPAFANARNATAGTLKLLDPKAVAKRPLDCVFYAQGEVRGRPLNDQQQLLDCLRAFGLKTQAFCRLVHDLEDMLEAIHELEQRRHEFPYDIDGAVIKVNSFGQRERIGFTSRAPSWAKAYKYAAEERETTLEAITVQVGRTGVLTPVAELKPVFVAGSTISRATLHNADYIREKDVRVGDTVRVRKAGDVIPEVVSVVLDKRPEHAPPFDLVDHVGHRCPSCGQPVSRDPDVVAWRCNNLQCPAQNVRRIQHLAGRSAMDIEALGGSVAEKLVERGLVSEPLDLFDLTVDDVARLNLGTDDEPRVLGEKNATKVVDAVNRARTMPLERWLVALGIPNVGTTTAYHIARTHDDLDAVANSAILRDIVALDAMQQKLAELNPSAAGNRGLEPGTRDALRKQWEQTGREVNDIAARLQARGLARQSSAQSKARRFVTTVIGPKTARSVIDFFASETGKTIRERLDRLSIHPTGKNRAEAAGKAAPDSAPLAGRTFVLTGTLESMSRNEARERIRALGGTAAGSVSTNTDYLVTGANTGAAKTRKAAALGITVIDEKSFLAMLADAESGGTESGASAGGNDVDGELFAWAQQNA